MQRSTGKAKAILLQASVTVTGVIKGILLLKLIAGLGKEHYAFISQFLVIGMIGAQALMAGFDAPMVSDTATQKSECAPDALKLVILINLLGLCLLFLLAPEAIANFVWGDASHSTEAMLLLAYIGVQGLSLTKLTQFQGEKKFSLYTRYQMAQQLTQLAAIALTTWTGSIFYIVNAVILAELTVWTLTSLLVPLAPFIGKPTTKEKLIWIKVNLRVALPLFASTLLIWIITNGGRLVAVDQTDLKTLAMYSSTLAIAVLSSALTNPLCTVFFPYLSAGKGKNKEDSQSNLEQAQSALLATSTLLSIGILCLARPAIDYLAGPSFYAGPLFTFLICAGYIFFAQSRIVGLYHSINGSSGAIFRIYCLGSILFLAMAWLSSQLIGINGIALSFALGCFMLFSLLMKIDRKPSFKHLKLTASRFLVALLTLYTACYFDFSSFYTGIVGASLISAAAMIILYAVATTHEREVLNGMTSRLRAKLTKS